MGALLFDLLLGILVALPLLLTSASYVKRHWILHRGGPWAPPEGLAPVTAVGALLLEWLSLSVAVFAEIFYSFFFWWIPSRLVGEGSKGPIILISGAAHRFTMLPLAWRLRRDGWSPVYTFDAPGLRKTTEATAERLRAFIERELKGDLRPLTLIGHGMAGLAIRYYAKHFPAASLRRIVTLGCPHRGNEVRLLFDVPRDADVLRDLNAGDRLPQQFDVIAIHSSFDAMVQPPVYAMYPNAFNAQLNDVGHFAMLLSPKVYQLIRENLDAPLPAA